MLTKEERTKKEQEIAALKKTNAGLDKTIKKNMKAISALKKEIVTSDFELEKNRFDFDDMELVKVTVKHDWAEKPWTYIFFYHKPVVDQNWRYGWGEYDIYYRFYEVTRNHKRGCRCDIEASKIINIEKA